jgi:hypothetical protein
MVALYYVILFCLHLSSPLTLAMALSTPKVLIYSRTLGYRHASIPNAISALQSHAGSVGSGVTFDATEDPTRFNSSTLMEYDMVLFLMTTDSNDDPRVEVLDQAQKVRFGALKQSKQFPCASAHLVTSL